jgi:glycerophosphoryl diester phosphodiesterase
VTTRFQEVLRARTFLSVAHRGASAYAPENTMEAFTLAVEQGVDVIELDVHLTRDGEMVVMHDHRVDRTTSGTGEISALDLREIQELDAGGWFGAPWRGVRVPMLEEVFDRFAERVWIDIEIKAGVRARWLAGTLEEDTAVTRRVAERVLAVAGRHGALDRIVVSSFGPAALRWVRETSSRIATQLSVFSAEIAADCAAAAAAGFDVISPQVYAASERNVGAAHTAGLAVQIYTGAEEDDEVIGRLLDLGVDGVKTNRPDRLRALLAARSAG